LPAVITTATAARMTKPRASEILFFNGYMVSPP
jgi:hypothetical protein